MKIIDGRNLYPIYKNFDGTHWLIVSGMGKQNAAAATAYLYSVSSASDSASWINLGIAGCGIGKYGDLCLVDKISDNSLQNRYPITIPKINLPTIRTVILKAKAQSSAPTIKPSAAQINTCFLP